MISCDDFIMASLVVFVSSFILAMGLFYLSYYWSKICRILGIVFVVVFVFAFGFGVFVMGVFDENSVLNIEPNKTYLDPEVSTAEIHICPLDETPYFLVQDKDEYIYQSIDADDKETYRIDASQCEFKFSDEKPGIFMQNITTKCRAEWFFLYNDKTEQKQKYLITVPSKESILNLDE